MQITLATNKDLDGILALKPQIYRIDSLPANARQMLSDLIEAKNCDVLVAKEKDKKANEITGYAILFYIPIPAHGKHFAFLEGMVVDKNHRQKGIGTALVKKVIELARQKNCYKILFTSGLDRKDAHQFYEKQGFKKWGLEFRMDLPTDRP